MSIQDKQLPELEEVLRKTSHALLYCTRSFLAARGLTVARFFLLSNLKLDKPVSLGQVKEYLMLSPSTLTGLLDSLTEDGLVKRWRDETDRRLVFLQLTPQGDALVQEVLQYRISILGRALQGQKKMIGEFNSGLHLILESLKSEIKTISNEVNSNERN